MMLSMMKQVTTVKSRLEIESRNLDPSMFHSCRAVLHASLEANAAMTQVQVQDPFVSKEKRRASLGA